MSEPHRAANLVATATGHGDRPRLRAPVPGFDFSGRSIAFWALILFGLIGVPLLYSSGHLSVDNVNMLGRYMAFAILAISLDLIWGYSGILCLCQSLFFALGGYAMGMYLAMHGPLDPPPNGTIPRCLFVVSSQVSGFKLPWFWAPFENMTFGVAAGLCIPGLLALIVGYFGFASRVRGVYFAILTQALTLAAWNVFCLNNMLLCGTNGLTNFVTVAGWTLAEPRVKVGLYVATILLFLLVYLLCGGLICSRLGRVLIAIRDNENRLRFSGYRPHAFKIFVFTVSAMIAGLAGMIYSPQAGIMTPEYMNAGWSMSVVIWVAVGGRGTLSGAAIGALLVNLMYNFLTTRCPDFWPFMLGALFVGSPLIYAKGMLNARGALFLVALLLVPPAWTTATGMSDALPYWIPWIALSAPVLWLVWDTKRIELNLGARLYPNGIFFLVAQAMLFIPEVLLARQLLHFPTIEYPPTLIYWLTCTCVALNALLLWLWKHDRVSVLLAEVFESGTTPTTVGQVAAPPLSATQQKLVTEGAAPRIAADNGQPKAESMEQRLSRVSLLQRSEADTSVKGELLRVENVQVLFDGFKALDIGSFSLGFYELRVIIGPNGAGKTTLCDVISGKSRASTGRVHFANREVTSMKETEIARLGVGRKFQTPTVFDSLTVYQNMELALPGRQGLFNNLFGRTNPAERERILSILHRVRLLEKLNTEVRYLSHGQRQWLEISMLILAAPMLLLVDEPAAGLTDEETVLTAELLLELQSEHSIIVIEHDMDFVRLLASRVTVLNEGKVMADGTLDQVQADPQVIEAYLGR